ncbi:hypothetical protein TNCT_452291 [Trichonephila clavata]|uniref:Uncharacterized protein n=1 Tax=Trichonephila clavata TaxID=2740835 RepID=A0A8X6KG11_TRICU|nr:hypothetical protein TNCT_452291 [Trichonephila clavata]
MGFDVANKLNFNVGILWKLSLERPITPFLADLFYSKCFAFPDIPEEQNHVFKGEFYRSLLDNGARNDDGAQFDEALTLEIVEQKPDFASD